MTILSRFILRVIELNANLRSKIFSPSRVIRPVIRHLYISFRRFVLSSCDNGATRLERKPFHVLFVLWLIRIQGCEFAFPRP